MSDTDAAAKTLSRMMIEHNDYLNRSILSLKELVREISKETENLRQENMKLHLENGDLRDRIFFANIRTQPNSPENTQEQCNKASVFQKSAGVTGSSSATRIRVPSPVSGPENTKLRLANVDIRNRHFFANLRTQPYSLEYGEVEKTQEECNKAYVSSNRFQKSAGVTGSSSAPLCSATRIRAPSPVSSPNDGPIELDIYNQGMFKTVLRNNWHFLHALTDEETLILPLRLD